MSSQSITEAQASMLLEGKGGFTEFNQSGMSLKEAGLIDATPIDDHRYKWEINQEGKTALAEKIGR